MSDFLFARPSFLEGAGRVIDLFGVMQEYNTSPSMPEADRRAILSDWLAIGDDFKFVVKNFENEAKTSKA